MGKRKQSREGIPSTSPHLQGSHLVSTLQNWRKQALTSGFRRRLAPTWDLPAHLDTHEKASRFEGVTSHLLANVTLSANSSDGKHNALDGITACQLGAAMLREAWPLGDAPVLGVFRATLASIRHDTNGLRKGHRDILEPIRGHSMTIEDPEAPATGVEGADWVIGALQAWAKGSGRDAGRETAREWSRELEHAMFLSAQADSEHVASSVDELTEACCRDIVSSGYAFAVAFLTLDAALAEEAVYRMVRTHIGMLMQRFLQGDTSASYPVTMREAMAADAYRAASRPWITMYLRTWPMVAGKVLEGGIFPAPREAQYIEAGAAGEAEMRAARLRGYVPCLHRIPMGAFRVEATELEQEEER
jgi:hypothetical protein